MNSKSIRKQFIDFFKEKEHAFVRSSPVAPLDDPTLLFTNAGMNQFKNIFLGQENAKHLRVVNSQKCIRVSGKHNDLEEVGVDTFHHTFFEMLGNWSFGDYYKEEAIKWAWELFTEVWKLPKERLWATVYEEDIEAEELWQKVTNIDPARILRCGKKDNFWEMGETGPCGPCSEIHYYVGSDLSKQSKDGVNISDQYWELWNLVFIQNNRLPDGTLEDLPKKHVDTGAGLERIVTVMQEKTSNYDTDLFQPIIKEIEYLTNSSYSELPIPHRVIADHIRMLSFSITDGVLPSNEGRGYVARRILRRAARFGRILGVHEPFLYKLADTVIEEMGEVYPEMIERQKHVKNVIKAEEISFNETLDRGLENFEKILSSISGKEFPGREAFKLYDTYGFPLDLTEQMAREKGLIVDIHSFEEAMAEQKARARSSAKFNLNSFNGKWTQLTEGDNSIFIGYDHDETTAVIRQYQFENDNILIILDRTSFYAESGGQVGDTGFITGDGYKIEVVNTIKDGQKFIHVGKMIEGESITSPKVKVNIDTDRRQSIKLHHTATHLLHKALKIVLGDHVHQAGSLLNPDYLRFDLTHYEKMSPEQIRKVEEIVNQAIRENMSVEVSLKDFETARNEGAMALFGEKYGDEVRVVKVDGFSKELCGGTHVSATGNIGFFKITEESSLAAGVRRIFAVTGSKAVDYILNGFDKLSAIQVLLNSSENEIVTRIEKLLEQKKTLEKQLKKRNTSGDKDDISDILKKVKKVNNYNTIATVVEAGDLNHLKNLGDYLLEKLGSGIGVLGSILNDKPNLVCIVSQDLIRKGIKAGDLSKRLGKIIGGGGGGKPHLATAGGKDVSKLMEAIVRSQEIIEEIVKKV